MRYLKSIFYLSVVAVFSFTASGEEKKFFLGGENKSTVTQEKQVVMEGPVKEQVRQEIVEKTEDAGRVYENNLQEKVRTDEIKMPVPYTLPEESIQGEQTKQPEDGNITSNEKVKIVAEHFMSTAEKENAIDDEIRLQKKRVELLKLKKQAEELEGKGAKTAEVTNKNMTSKDFVKSVMGDSALDKPEEADPTKGIVFTGLAGAADRIIAIIQVFGNEGYYKTGSYITDDLMVKEITNTLVYLQDQNGKEHKLRLKSSR